MCAQLRAYLKTKNPYLILGQNQKIFPVSKNRIYFCEMRIQTYLFFIGHILPQKSLARRHTHAFLSPSVGLNCKI